MLSRRIQPRLCQTCRNDLWALFESGLGTPSAPPIRRQQFHWSPHHKSPLRGERNAGAFSSRRRLRHADLKPHEVPNTVPSDGDGEYNELATENIEEILGDGLQHGQPTMDPKIFDPREVEASRTEAEKELWEGEILSEEKQEYGIRYSSDEPFQEAIQAGDVDLRAREEMITEVETQHEKSEERNPVEAVRDADGSVEEIAREARQLHGEYLPEGVLFEDEARTYKRLYGEPAEEMREEETTQVVEESNDAPELLDHDGAAIAYEKGDKLAGGHESPLRPLTEMQMENVSVEKEKNLEQRMMEVAKQVGGHIQMHQVDQSEEEPEEAAVERSHPLTVAGRFHTTPRTIFLPQESFVRPIQNVLADYSNKHIKEMSERLFGGPGLPDSPLTPRIGRVLPQKPIPLDASQPGMGPMEANAYISTIWPSTYAAVTSVLVETRKRLGSTWLRDLASKEGGGPSVLDAGGGGVGILAWRDILSAEWEALHSSDASPPPPPLGKATVLTGADNLRYRAAALLENTTFLPRLPDYVHVRDGTTLSDDRPASQRKKFDVVIAPHTLWPLGEEWRRKQHVQNLWSLLNPDGGVLIIIEKGVPRGFEVVAGARELLLSRHMATEDSPLYESQLESSNQDETVHKGKGMIIAPCTNHAPCPLYTVPGVSRGRKDYCSFQQRYIRPPFLQRVLGARDRNHDDVDFSYLAVQKGRDLKDVTVGWSVTQGREATDSAFKGHEGATGPEETDAVNHLSLPRLIYPPLKRPGHVTIDVCTPAGKIDRWTVTKSFSKVAYRDARKAHWGDLWALGAKTRVARNLQLGGEKSKRGKSVNEQMKSKAQKIYQRMEEDKVANRRMAEDMELAEKEADRELLDEDVDKEDEYDADAAQVLRQIEREERQRRAVGTASTKSKSRLPKEARQKSESASSGTKADTHPAPDETETASRDPLRPRSLVDDMPPQNYRDPSPPSPAPSSTTTASHPSTAPYPDLNHNQDRTRRTTLPPLSAAEQGYLRDFASESRADALASLAAQKLSSYSQTAGRRPMRREGEEEEEEKGEPKSWEGETMGKDKDKESWRNRKRERRAKKVREMEEEAGGSAK